jgi:uncharacterized repeat protein (TIGR03803 family)
MGDPSTTYRAAASALIAPGLQGEMLGLQNNYIMSTAPLPTRSSLCISIAVLACIWFCTLVGVNAGTLEQVYAFPTNSRPYAGLVLGADGAFYGTTVGGGGGGFGTAFRITPTGEMTTLISFTGTNGPCRGAYPYGGLIQGNDKALYGTTSSGGYSNVGTVFRVTTNGVFQSLASFSVWSCCAASFSGALPFPGLLLAADGAFYGVTDSGSPNMDGAYICNTGTKITCVYGCGNYPRVFRLTTNHSINTFAVFYGANNNNRSPVRGPLLSLA